MSLRRERWALSAATLSNGAQLKAAANGKPQRVGPAEPIDVGALQGNNISSYLFSDGQAVWLSSGKILVYSSVYNRLQRLDANNGYLADWTWNLGPQTSQRWMWVDEAADELYFSFYFNLAAPVKVYRLSDLPTLTLLRTWPNLTGVLNSSATFGAATGGRVFMGDWGSVLREFDANGNVVATFGTSLNGNAGGGLINGTNLFLGTQGQAYKIDISGGVGSMVLSQAFATQQGNPAQGGGRGYWADDGHSASAGRGVIGVDGNTAYVFASAPVGVKAFDHTTGAFLSKIVGAGDQPGAFSENGYGVAIISPDGTKALFGGVGGSNYRGLGVYAFDTRTARARWQKTFASAVTVTDLIFPGDLGNESFATPYSYPESDDRKTLCYWSLDGGVTRTAFRPGTPLSIAVAAGQTLTVDADMSAWGKRNLIQPWIGGDSGEGPTVIWDDGSVQGAPLGGGIAAGASLGGSIAAGAPLGGSIR